MNLVIYDNECIFCTTWVVLVLRHDTSAKYHFTSLHGPMAEDFFAKKGIKDKEMIWLVGESGAYHTKSSATLRIMGSLGGLWTGLYVLLVIPKPLRDMVYTMVSKRRRQLMGKRSCPIIDAKYHDRFHL